MKGNILIVDDDLDTVEMLRQVLTEAGYATRAAGTGNEALRKARRTPPDLVLLDLILPDLNGFYVCTALRLDPATASVPIVMMTAVPGEIPRMSGFEAGADAYLNKPFSIDGLVALVNDLLHGTRSRPADFESAQPLAASLSSPYESNRRGIAAG
jgi:DNA-binding response OmpR family regulator